MSIIFRQDADIPEYHFMAFSESLEELILTGISNDDLVEVKKTDLQVGIKYRGRTLKDVFYVQWNFILIFF